jgi:hypothetical protein
MSVRVLVCGSRDWTDDRMICAVLDGLWCEVEIGHLVAEMATFTLIEGGAKGADAIAKWWADSAPAHGYNERGDDEPHFEHLSFPADWVTHGRAAGPIRNRQMLTEGKPDLVIAFKDGLDLASGRGGTEHMVKIAKDAGIEVWVMSHA